MTMGSKDKAKREVRKPKTAKKKEKEKVAPLIHTRVKPRHDEAEQSADE
jgi:hypothetical protein